MGYGIVWLGGFRPPLAIGGLIYTVVLVFRSRLKTN